jgi:hypothetical protein
MTSHFRFGLHKLLLALASSHSWFLVPLWVGGPIVVCVSIAVETRFNKPLHSNGGLSATSLIQIFQLLNMSQYIISYNLKMGILELSDASLVP